mgnify:CR=1 FL=1
MTQNCYTVGQTVCLSVSFVDQTGASVTPAAVTLSVRDPSQALTAFGSGSGLVQDAPGAFHVDFTTALAGAHLYRWQTTGPACAAENQFFTETAF